MLDSLSKPRCDLARAAFLDFIRDGAFPCVGAKSAAAGGQIKVVAGNAMTSAWNDLVIHRELMAWADAYNEDQDGLRSLAVVFEGPASLSEVQFETAMWERLQSLSDKDAWLGQPPDTAVSHEPDDPHFALSFGGKAFFVVGLHPNASRPGRRFEYPAMVFNLHDQFEQLRATGKYGTMRKKIMVRDEALAGTVNPMLSQHGEVSAARQYSGRLVGENWRCPFCSPRS